MFKNQGLRIFGLKSNKYEGRSSETQLQIGENLNNLHWRVKGLVIVSFHLQALSTSFTTIYSLYNSFVGAPHFAMMTKLLGYQGIAVVIEELLKIIRSLVSTNIICCIKLIRNYLSMEKLDKNCHLQIFVFGLANTSFSNLVSIRFKVWLRLGPT